MKQWTLDDKVRRCLKGSGFDNPLLVGNFRVEKSLIRSLLELFDERRYVFSIGGELKQDICFSLEDVMFITGLPIDGKAVTGVEATSPEEVCARLLGKNGCELKGEKYNPVVSLNWLQQNFMKVPQEVAEESDDIKVYVRAFVLFVIGCLIVPSATGAHVSVHYLPLLEDITEIKSYAWGAALLAHLLLSFNKVAVKQRKDGAGFYFALMVSNISVFSQVLFVEYEMTNLIFQFFVLRFLLVSPPTCASIWFF